MSRLIDELLPPDTPAITRWRLTVAGCVALLMAQAAASYGLFSWAGVPGFASRASFEEMSISMIEERIYDAKRLWCAVSEDPNRASSRRFYSGEISRMHLKYYKLTGIRMDIPTCDEVGP